MTHDSLFSGIGGFELGAQWALIPTLWNCEIEPHITDLAMLRSPLSITMNNNRPASRGAFLYP